MLERQSLKQIKKTNEIKLEMLRKPAWSGDLTWWSVVDASDLESSSFWPLFALNGCDTVYNCEKAFCVFLLALIVSPHLATVGPDTPGGGQ